MTTMHDLEFEFEDVQSFNDQESPDTSSKIQPKNQQKKRKDWIYVQTFESGEQALQAMNQCSSYSYKRSHETSAGKAIFTRTAFYKTHKCKHIIGILARKDIYPNGSITIPQGAKSISIEF